MNEISRRPAHAVAELASTRQHQAKLADHHGARGGGYGTKVINENPPTHPAARGVRVLMRVLFFAGNFHNSTFKKPRQ